MAYPRKIETTERATYWEVVPGVFNATKGEEPKGQGGYANLVALKKLKGDAR